MEGDQTTHWVISVLLVLASIFFVAAEYGLISIRKSRIESLVRKGNRTAQLLLEALQQIASYVAGIQIGITMLGIAIGATTEPLVNRWVTAAVGQFVPPAISALISLLLVTYVLVIIGELVPKYLTLRYPENVALALIRPLRFFLFVARPLVWLVQHSGALILRPFHINIQEFESATFSKEEIGLLVKAGRKEGAFEEEHAEMISRALKLDTLDSSDVMIHRIDIKWIEASTPKEQLFSYLAKIPYSRVPVCLKDIDQVVGILFIQDLFKHWQDPDFELLKILRPVEVVPENLPLSRVIKRMREVKTEMLIVRDEYGGTSGLLTLEDIVEEVFGEIEDQLENDRLPIEISSPKRLSMKANVRFDEVVSFLGLENHITAQTDTLANLITESIDHVPHLGDSVITPVGTLTVENMARNRITRVSLVVLPSIEIPQKN